MKIFGSVIAASALTGSAAYASEQPELVDGSGLDTVLELMKGFGPAELNSDGEVPFLQGEHQELIYFADFEDCNETYTVCNTILFNAYWDLEGEASDAAALNAFNSEIKFGRAYIDADGDYALEMGVNLNYGVTRENLNDSIDWWIVGMTDFHNRVFVGENDE